MVKPAALIVVGQEEIELVTAESMKLAGLGGAAEGSFGFAIRVEMAGEAGEDIANSQGSDIQFGSQSDKAGQGMSYGGFDSVGKLWSRIV